MNASICLPHIVRNGDNGFAATVEVLRQFGLSRPLIVTDAFMVSSGVAGRLVETLGVQSRCVMDSV